MWEKKLGYETRWETSFRSKMYKLLETFLLNHFSFLNVSEIKP
jgi:hypothetical protein